MKLNTKSNRFFGTRYLVFILSLLVVTISMAVDPPIDQVVILEPDITDSIYWCVDNLQILECNECHDLDCNPTTHLLEDDSVIEYWQADHGTFPLGNVGTMVLYQCPSTPCIDMITVSADDAYQPVNNNWLWVNDPPTTASFMTTVLKVDLIGDIDDDGDIDADDETDKTTKPLIVAINEDWRTLIVRKVGITAGGTLKIKKVVDSGIIITKVDGTVILGATDTESGDILADAGSSDLTLKMYGTKIGWAILQLIFDTGFDTYSDYLKVRVVRSDIVQRSGNTSLASLISESLTHSGIDWEKNVTDLYDPGIEQISLSTFNRLADGGPATKRLRLKRSLYMAHRIWAKVYDNMEAKSYALPMGSKPWNVFSTSINYTTANCNEFVKEQFRLAISDIYGELTKPTQQSNFKTTYYSGTSVCSLCDGKHVMCLGGISPTAATLAYAMVLYVEYRSKKVGATTLFQNTFEGEVPIFWFNSLNGMKYDAGYAPCSVCGSFPSLPWYLYPVVDLYDEAHISTITPSCLSGSAYFETITY